MFQIISKFKVYKLHRLLAEEYFWKQKCLHILHIRRKVNMSVSTVNGKQMGVGVIIIIIIICIRKR